MRQERTFEEIPEEEYILGKGYNDGNHTIWIERTTNPRARNRRKYHAKAIEITTDTLEELLKTGQKTAKKLSCKETPDMIENAPKKAKEKLTMTPRALFDILCESYSKLKWKEKRGLLISALLPYHKDYTATVEFVEQNLKRRKHNRSSRYLRAFRKCTMNRFNYFVTFTYDDKKMNVDEFKQRLRDYLSNKVKRDGWKYLGVWEGWDGERRRLVLYRHILRSFVIFKSCIVKNRNKNLKCIVKFANFFACFIVKNAKFLLTERFFYAIL